jgi:hypothetical protein
MEQAIENRIIETKEQEKPNIILHDDDKELVETVTIPYDEEGFISLQDLINKYKPILKGDNKWFHFMNACAECERTVRILKRDKFMTNYIKKRDRELNIRLKYLQKMYKTLEDEELHDIHLLKPLKIKYVYKYAGWRNYYNNYTELALCDAVDKYMKQQESVLKSINERYNKYTKSLEEMHTKILQLLEILKFSKKDFKMSFCLYDL